MEDPAQLMRQWLQVGESILAFASVEWPPTAGDDQGIPTIASPEHVAGLLRETGDSNMDVDPITGGRVLRPRGPVVSADRQPEIKRRYDISD
jgi:hypothetical protein